MDGYKDPEKKYDWVKEAKSSREWRYMEKVFYYYECEKCGQRGILKVMEGKCEHCGEDVVAKEEMRIGGYVYEKA